MCQPLLSRLTEREFADDIQQVPDGLYVSLSVSCQPRTTPVCVLGEGSVM